ncbi:MAG: FKBP-type peptidyl-prolyl cis-trans isomerase [Planctomycetota bacterium]
MPAKWSRLCALLAAGACGALAGCDPDPQVASDPAVDVADIQRYADYQQPDPPDADGLRTTRSGLRYAELEAGTGRRPGYGSTVVVHYRGWNEDGQVFDESYRRGEPTRLPLNEVIDGWSEGLRLMREGARYRFIIPPYLAYGRRGSPPLIGPDETLTFEVELIEVR